MLFPAQRAHGSNPPNPLGLAERVPRPHPVEGVPSLHLHPPGSPAGQNLRFCRRLHIGALRSPLSPFAPSRRNLLVPPPPSPLPKDLPPRGRGTARRRWKEFPRIAPPYHPSRALSKPFMQPRVQGRNPARFNGGYGVPRGFKGGSKPSAPCGRLSEAEHPKRKGATLLRPLSAVNRNLPGNSHSRASAPCDFRFPPCFFPHSGRMAPIPLIP